MKMSVMCFWGGLWSMGLAVAQTNIVVEQIEQPKQQNVAEDFLTKEELEELANEAQFTEEVTEEQKRDVREKEQKEEEEKSAPDYSARQFNHCCHYLIRLGV